MTRSSASLERSFGYLTAVESVEFGYFGGYLIVSQLGRPLEFHCTAPLQPSRAQKILYGPTLEPYLLGEQICGALLGVAKLVPEIILTDCAAALESRSRFAVPMVRLAADEISESASRPNETCGGCKLKSHVAKHHPDLTIPAAAAGDFTVNGYQFSLAYGFEAEQQSVENALMALSQRVDLAEPFARIREAIGEAQRLGGKGTDAHEQAA